MSIITAEVVIMLKAIKQRLILILSLIFIISFIIGYDYAVVTSSAAQTAASASLTRVPGGNTPDTP